MTPLDSTDWALREAVYAGLAATGMVPPNDALLAVLGSEGELADRLRKLHDHHRLVLDEDGVIRMALPFSAIPTDHVVVSGGRRWFANCAWDALAIPAALDIDATVDARWADDGSSVELRVAGRRLVGETDGFVHFAVAARRWWDDIAET